MSTDSEIKVLLTAEIAQLQAGMDAGAASVAKSTEEMRATVAQEAEAFNAAVQTKIDAMVRLNAAFAGGITSTTAIAEAESALDQAMAAGAVTAAEYASYVGKLNASEIDLAASTTAATVATEANTVAMTINGGVARELGVLMGELARGNYTRMEGSTVTLANRTGLLSSALNFLISPLGLAAEAAVALGVAAYQASQDEDALRESIINTGDVSGYNVDQLRAMERALRDIGATASQAKEAVLATASAGNLLGANFQNAAQAAVDMAQLTGISVQKAVAEISKLQEDPVKAIQKLNETMNFLSPTEAAEIKHLQDIGDKAGAATRAIADLADAESKRVKAQRDAGGGAESFTGKLSNDAQSVWAGVKGIFSKGDLQEQLDQVNKELTQYSEDFKGAITQDSNNQLKVDQSKIGWGERPIINKLLQDRAELMAKITAEGAAQEAQSAKTQADQTQVNSILSAKAPKAPTAGHVDHAQAQADRDAFNQQRLQHSMSLAEEKTYWQDKLAAAKEGTDAYRQAVNELLQIKSKGASESKAEARQEIAEAHHVAAEKIRATKEAEREAQAAARKQRELSLEQIKASHDEATGALTNKREQYQQEYSDGQISAANLLQLETELMRQKLAADLAYYQAKAKLDVADQVAVAKDGAAIVKSQQDALASMLRYEKEFHNNSTKEWNNYARKIEGAMQGAINGMLFQHQTLRQGVANISLVIGEDFIQQAVMKPLDAWISGEATKTAAALAGATQRQVIESGAAAVSKAADAATGKSQITSAAATAGAKAYQAIVGIPFVGPVLAPIAAGVAFAGVEAYGSMISSARGGWERVPIDGMMTELHKDEMVLPAHVANPIRDMAKGGGQGGGGNTFNIHANDAKSFKEMMRRDPAAFASVAKLAQRRGHFGGIR